ncbi:MAG: hypothetical protein V4482_06560 [Pseudomonadota bacterium]
MKNPFDHDAIESMGLRGLGDAPIETLAAYVYYAESIIEPQISSIDADLPIHDRLLEATLILFDTMLPDKAAIKRISPDMLSSPCIVKDFVPLAHGFFTRLFCQLSLAPNDFASKARLHMYTAYFNHWLHIWLSDETPDQSDTMAAIDQDLNQLREWKEWIMNAVPLNF